jgi:hypothetical protein
MTHDTLVQAVNAVEAASEDAHDTEISERLDQLAAHLQSQAEREGSPALGGLDRIQHSLQEVASRTDQEAVTTRIDKARDLIFSFLDTLDDRGMKQHGLQTDMEQNSSS